MTTMAPIRYNDKKEFLEDIKNGGANGWIILSPELADDKETILKAIEYRPSIIRYASKRLQNDREVALEAIKSNEKKRELFLYDYISEELKSDRAFAEAAIQINGNSLKFLSDDLRNDRELMLAAVKKGYHFDQFENKQFLDDKEIVLAAINCEGYNFYWISKRLKKDRDVILAAICSPSKEMDMHDYVRVKDIEDSNCKLVYYYREGKIDLSLLKDEGLTSPDDKQAWDAINFITAKKEFYEEQKRERKKRDDEMLRIY